MSGQGSQRTRNKARKTEIQAEFMKRGWRKPEHLTWHQVEHWLYRPENRYRGPAIQQGNLADMLNAHLRPWPAPAVPPQADTGGTPPGTRRSNAATGADHSQRPRHRRDTVHVRPHRAHLTWLNQATPPTLPPGNPLRRNNRLLALYSGNGRWDLRVILAPPRGGQRPFVARGIYPQVLFEPTNTVGHDVLHPPKPRR